MDITTQDNTMYVALHTALVLLALSDSANRENEKRRISHRPASVFTDRATSFENNGYKEKPNRRRDAWETERDPSQVFETPKPGHRIELRAKPRESTMQSQYQESFHNKGRSQHDDFDRSRHYTESAMKYKMALDERPTAASTDHYHNRRASVQQSDAVYTLRAPSSTKNTNTRGRADHDNRSYKKGDEKPRVSVLDCKHACKSCCPNCSTLQSGAQLITLAISSPVKCNCGAKKQLATPSVKSIQQKEKELSRTGTFGMPGNRVTSPPSQKSSVISQSAQQGKDKGIYNLIYSQNKMIRQITSELSKQRDITVEIEKGLRDWKDGIMKSDERRPPSPELEIRDEREIERFSVEDRPRSRLSQSQHTRSERSMQDEFDAAQPAMDSVRKSIATSVDKFRTASFRRGPIEEATPVRPRCNSVDDNLRKRNLKQLPHSGSSELMKDQNHHQRCCLNGSKKKAIKKPKVAAPHIYTLTYCGSACKQPSLPFKAVPKPRPIQATRRPKPDPRYMYPVHRQPGAVIDALADIVARRLKVELKP